MNTQESFSIINLKMGHDKLKYVMIKKVYKEAKWIHF